MQQKNERVILLNKAIEQNNIDDVTTRLAGFDSISINEFDTNDVTTQKRPIDVAVERGTPAMVDLVCQKTPNLNMRGCFPLHKLMHRATTGTQNIDDLKAIFATLYSAGANPNAKDADGNTILHLAVSKKPLHIFVKILILEFGCDLNEPDKLGHTPLWIAKDLFGLKHPLIELLESLGARETSDATQAFFDQVNSRTLATRAQQRQPSRSYNSGVLEFFRQGLESQAPKANTFEDDTPGSDTDEQTVPEPTPQATVNPVVPREQKPKVEREDPIVAKLIECIQKEVKDISFQFLFNALKRKANKVDLAQLITERYAANQSTKPKSANQEQRIELIRDLLVVEKTHEPHTESSTMQCN